MYAVLVSALSFLAVFGGAIAGVGLARLLPAPHLNAETRTAVSVSMAVVGTFSTLVLSLMITNASSSFATKSDAVTTLAVDVLKLDRTLVRYGTETAAARDALQVYARAKAQDLSTEGLSSGLGTTTLRLLELVNDEILDLHPQDSRHASLKKDALALTQAIADSRWTLVAKAETTVSSPFLGLLIFWLALLFASFGLFAPRNATVITVLLLSAIAVAGGIFMILELDSATGGLIRVSVDPMNAAIAETAVQ